MDNFYRMADDPGSDRALPSGVDTTTPHSARVWNYWLDGEDNFPADRAVGDQVFAIYPEIVAIARASRAFLRRSVSYLTAEAGIRQFLDIGTGLPTADNTHQVAQRIAPETRVVYVDNDPLVLTHARSLLTSTADGATAYLDADVHDLDTILRGATELLDFTRPIAVMLLGLMGNVADTDEAYSIVARLIDAVPAGSYLVVNDGTTDHGGTADEAAKARRDAGDPYNPRTPEEIAGFFNGLDLVEPGVVSTPLWRPEPGMDAVRLNVHCGVARKPSGAPGTPEI